MKKLTFFLVAVLALVVMMTACNNEKTPVDTGTGTSAPQTEPTEGTTEPTPPACAHVEGDWIVDANATCTEDGARHTVCTLCGETVKNETIPASHIVTNWIVDTPAKIGVKGSQHTECVACNTTIKTEEIPALVPSEGLQFISNGDGTCYVNSSGTCTDVDVVIPLTSPDGDRVTGIGSRAFTSYTRLRSVTIHDDVTSIGDHAFAYCNALTEVNFGSGVTTLSEGLFYSCDALLRITIPEGVTEIGMRVFYDCNGLVSIELPSTLTDIGRMAFTQCDKLAEIINHSSVKIKLGAIGNGGIAETAMEVHDGESSIRVVDDFMFYTCEGKHYLVGYTGDKTELTLPESYKGEGYEVFKNAFIWNLTLESVTIPDTVTAIGDNAFFRCVSLKNIQLPDGIDRIGIRTFAWCTSLTSIELPDSLTVIDEHAFEDCHRLESIVIPEGVTTVGLWAFWRNAALKSVTIPTTLKIMGEYAFSGCDELEEIHITDVAAWCGMTFGEDTIDPFTGSVDLYVNDKLVTDLVIPDGIETLPKFVFLGFSSLKSVTISKDVKNIEQEAFFHCVALTDVYYEGSEADWKKITIGEKNECLTNAKIHYNCD